jgi:hypothetical protein
VSPGYWFGRKQGKTASASALGGRHYLPTNSPHRNAGTTNLPAAVLALLARTTTDAPVVFTNGTFTQPTNFPVRVARDTNAPDLGYHYAPLDYLFGGCSFQTNATFEAGVAVGWFRTSSGWYHTGQGIHLADRQILTFAGTVAAPNWWVRANTVQERDRTGGYGPGGITGRASQWEQNIAKSPEVHATFLKCSMLANDMNHFRDDWGYLIVRASHSELWGASAGGYLMSLYLTNCLIVRCHSAINEGFPGNEFIWRNVTMLGGHLWVEPSYLPIPLSLQDSVFDGTVIYSGGDPTNRDHRHNAYRIGANQLSPAGPGNVTVTNFHWQPGPLGRFYHGVTNLTDAGSSFANLRGLAHFTTQPDQTPEAGSVVDLGYHYLPVPPTACPSTPTATALPITSTRMRMPTICRMRGSLPSLGTWTSTPTATLITTS